MINDVYALLFTTDLDASTVFYRDALGLVVVFEADWYVQFHGPDRPQAQLALIDPDHDSIPAGFRRRPAGVAVTLEVDDADAVHRLATSAGAEIVLSLRDEPFGQRHFMTVDPDGLLVDVVQPIDPDPAFAAEHGLS